VSDGIGLLYKKIDNFPAVDAYKAIIDVLGKKNYANQMRIAELHDVLAELATPIIRLWQDVILVPVIGTLDSQRAQNMAEKLLESIADTRAKVVIVDVTGVSMIDTIVGEFLIEMFSAVKLLGSDVILTGIKPEIAHTLVKLSIDFNMVIIKRDLESALKYAIREFSKDTEKNSLTKKEGMQMKNKIIPTIKLYDYLIVSIQIELDDDTIEKLQMQLLNEISERNIRGIIIDVSMVDVIDSYISFVLSETAGMAKAMGCYTVICKIQPQVALTLAQMGIKLNDVFTANSLESAIDILNRLD
jgi:rsbT co-antagonist protein RsbR